MTAGWVAPQRQIWTTVVLAAGLWFATFFLQFSNFWLKITASAALLAGLSLGWQRGQFHPRLRVADLLRGVASAVLLWAIFWVGKKVSVAIFPFAGGQVGAIYAKGEGVPRWGVFLLLLLITGPCEEIYWRGFLQKNLMRRYGSARGWALATVIYAGVHLWSLNFMLVGAAAVAGAFWGLLYWQWGRLAPVIVSHSLWSSFVFSVFPIP